MLHTKNQLPRLPGSVFKVPGGVVGWGGWVAYYPLLSQAPTPVEVELGCDKLGDPMVLSYSGIIFHCYCPTVLQSYICCQTVQRNCTYSGMCM
jgi:hypothetical protein